MIKRSILLFGLSLCVNSKRLNDIFNLDADEVIKSEIGEDFYAMRKRLHNMPVDLNDTMTKMLVNEQNDTNLKANTTKAPYVSTTEKIRVATVPPEIAAKYGNTTLKEIKKRRFMMQLERLLNTHRSVADYLSDSDLDTLTRKVDQLMDKNKKNVPPETRRETYFDSESWLYTKYEVKTRYMNLITHFTYITRYKLVFPQVLRLKYLTNPQYRIGFLFALVRHLKNMQKWVFEAFRTYGHWVDGSINWNLKMYEKILRLDVDIKDVVLLIEKMEYHRNIQYNPKFYDYSLEQYD